MCISSTRQTVITARHVATYHLFTSCLILPSRPCGVHSELATAVICRRRQTSLQAANCLSGARRDWPRTTRAWWIVVRWLHASSLINTPPYICKLYSLRLRTRHPDPPPRSTLIQRNLCLIQLPRASRGQTRKINISRIIVIIIIIIIMLSTLLPWHSSSMNIARRNTDLDALLQSNSR